MPDHRPQQHPRNSGVKPKPARAATQHARSGLVITTTASAAHHVLTVYGIFDSSTYPRIRHKIEHTARRGGSRAIIVDVTRLAVAASTPWPQFSTTSTPIGDQPAVPLALVCDSTVGQQLLYRSGINDQVPIYGTIAAAIAALPANGKRTPHPHTEPCPEIRWLTSLPTTPIEIRYNYAGSPSVRRRRAPRGAEDSLADFDSPVASTTGHG